MPNMSAGRITMLINALDPASRSRVRLFAIKLFFVLAFSLLFAERGLPFFAAASWLGIWYSLFAGAAALLRREKIGAATLNGWDEMAVFDAFALLMHVFARVSS
jgi:hypothetical protein